MIGNYLIFDIDINSQEKTVLNDKIIKCVYIKPYLLKLFLETKSIIAVQKKLQVNGGSNMNNERLKVYFHAVYTCLIQWCGWDGIIRCLSLAIWKFHACKNCFLLKGNFLISDCLEFILSFVIHSWPLSKQQSLKSSICCSRKISE